MLKIELCDRDDYREEPGPQMQMIKSYTVLKVL